VGIFDNSGRCGRGRIVNVKKGVGVADWSLLCFQRFQRGFGIVPLAFFLLFQASSVYLHGMGLDVSIGL